MKLTHEEHTAIRTRYDEVMAQAVALYGIDPAKVTLAVNLRGRCAGQARYTYGTGLCVVRLNPEAMRVGREHLLRETIPHELAHVVCYLTRLGANHDAGWRRVARSLGCKGERCHSLPLTPRGGGHRYVASCGTELVVSKVIHNRIQQGRARRLRKTGGRVAAEHYAPLTNAA